MADLRLDRAPALLASLALAAAGCAGMLSSPKTPEPLSAPQGSWRVFEDRWLRLKVPDTWEAARTAESPGMSVTWRIAPSGSRESLLMWGIITVTMYEDGREKRPLKTLFQEASSGRQKPVGRPRRERMGKGECVAFRTQAPSGTCQGPAAAPEKSRPCVESWLQMRCYGRGRRYFEIQSGLGRHPEGEPDAETQDRLRWADWILSGLEVR